MNIRWYHGLPEKDQPETLSWDGCLAVIDDSQEEYYYFEDWREETPVPSAKLRTMLEAKVKPQTFNNMAWGLQSKVIKGIDQEVQHGVSEEIYDIDSDLWMDEGL
jgi:hypothetical protein